MKTNHWLKTVAVTVVTGLVSLGAPVLAQDSSVANIPSTATVNSTAPRLAYGAQEILRLGQADVGDDMMIAYIKNSANGYSLNPEQILYLRQQGVSDLVITTMLNQPMTGLSEDAAPPPVPSPAAMINSGEPSVAVSVDPATIVDPEPVAPVAAGTTPTVNHEPVADAHAEPAFIYYPDPLAPCGNRPTVTVIYYQSDQSAPASPCFYQRQPSPVVSGYSVVSPGIGFGRLSPAGWSGGFQNTRRFHHGWHR